MFEANKELKEFARNLYLEQKRLDAMNPFPGTLTLSPDYIKQQRLVEKLKTRIVSRKMLLDMYVRFSY